MHPGLQEEDTRANRHVPFQSHEALWYGMHSHMPAYPVIPSLASDVLIPPHQAATYTQSGLADVPGGGHGPEEAGARAGSAIPSPVLPWPPACLIPWAWLGAASTYPCISLLLRSQVVHDNEPLQVVLNGRFVVLPWGAEISEGRPQPRLPEDVLCVGVHLPETRG